MAGASPLASGAERWPRLFAESGPAWLCSEGILPRRGGEDGFLRDSDDVMQDIGRVDLLQEEGASG